MQRIEENMRILGLDYGAKTVGVAVSDALGLTAQGIETIVRRDENKRWKIYGWEAYKGNK